ncbi:cytochrome P450 [Earliella scabrosa]|nr:cytochrome P450 [Earliella scabrosa]
MALLAVGAAAVVAFVLWRLFSNYIVRSPLDNIPGPPRASFWAGDVLKLLSQQHWEFARELIETYGPVAKLHNFFGAKVLHVYDTKALHSIFVKDQDSYYRGHAQISLSKILLGPGVFATYGAPHRKQRKMLNPVFSTAHMRNLTPLFYDITDKLRIAIETRVKDGPRELDILGWMGRTALELIGQGGLGHSFDPLIAESRDEYTEAVKAMVPAFSTIPWVRVFSPYFKYFGPAWLRRMLVNLVPVPAVHNVKRILDTVHARSVEILNAKRAAIQRGDQEILHMVGEGKDVMSILLKANLMAQDEDKLPDDELLAQMTSFILAGVDTTSNSLSRILHLLAENPDVQEKLRKEIHEAEERYSKVIPYDELSQLPYLDAICRETLRVHAPVNLSARQALTDTVLPLAEPIRGVDGKMMTEIPIPKGTFFFLNLRACNTNKALWGEDALEWKPERWLKPLPRTVEDARIPGIYANLMTFISGGHSCIGFKFSQLEMKVVLSVLISSFKFELSEKPIFWNFAGIAYPALSKESRRPEMHLKVSLARGA